MLGTDLCCFDPDRPDQLTTAINAALLRPDDFRRPLEPAFTERAGIERWLAAVTDLPSRAT